MNKLLQPLRWRCVECAIHHERDVREEQDQIYVARISSNSDCGVEALPILSCERLNLMTSVRGEWLWRMISIVACCHSAKLCTLVTSCFSCESWWVTNNEPLLTQKVQAKEGISCMCFINCTLRESIVLQGTYFILVYSMPGKYTKLL